jgi:hypothetical protein
LQCDGAGNVACLRDTPHEIVGKVIHRPSE